MVTVEVAVAAQATLGEGPAWDDRAHRLLWVDILENRVHASDLASGATRTRQFDEPIGAVIPSPTGGLVITTPGGVEAMDDLDGPTRMLVPIEQDVPANRMNDGKCDPSGALWTGTMDRSAEPERGTLYRVDPDLRVHAMVTGVTISNGLALDPDGTTVYFIDTPLHRVDRLILRDGVVARREVFADLSDQPGMPDGMTIDDTGCLWVAMLDGSCLLRIDPSGRVDRRVDLPVAWPSSVAFAGDGLDLLVITTGRSPQDAPGTPGGSVLAIAPGVTGAPTYAFGG